MVSGLKVTPFLRPSYGCCRPCQASRQVCKEKQQLRGEPIWYFNPCNSMQWRPLKFIFDSPPAQQIYLSTVLTFILLTAWFQVSQPPLFSSPLMAGAEPVKPADKSVKKSSSSKVSQFGILISASLCSNCPLKSYFVTTKAQQFPSAQLNFHSIDSLISGLTVASFLLPSNGCCRPRQASRQVCKEKQ